MGVVHTEQEDAFVPNYTITITHMTTTQKITLPLLGVLMLVGGGVAGYTGLAAAQSTDTSAGATTNGAAIARTVDRALGGHVGANGRKEEILTGDSAAKVTAAAQAAQPGATIDRVETDAEGAAYEAHITKTDGSHVTLKFDQNYAVTGTEDGPRGPKER